MFSIIHTFLIAIILIESNIIAIFQIFLWISYLNPIHNLTYTLLEIVNLCYPHPQPSFKPYAEEVDYGVHSRGSGVVSSHNISKIKDLNFQSLFLCFNHLFIKRRDIVQCKTNKFFFWNEKTLNVWLIFPFIFEM